MQDGQNENNNTASQNMRHPTKVHENTENADLADEKNDPSSQNKLKLFLVSLDIMQYMFYLPVYFTGPLFTFQDFNSQVKQSFRERESVCVCVCVCAGFKQCQVGFDRLEWQGSLLLSPLEVTFLMIFLCFPVQVFNGHCQLCVMNKNSNVHPQVGCVMNKNSNVHPQVGKAQIFNLIMINLNSCR